jgi:DNA-binding response OmpR family regulator
MIILDLRAGQESGLDLLREIRSRQDVPVITTGYGCSEMDCVIALELGADDHIAKPFGLRELLARIRAIQRRWQGLWGASRKRRPERDHYRFGGWQLDQRSRRLTDPKGEHVALTKGEYALLIAFLNAPRDRSSENICCRQRAFTRIPSIEASTCRSCDCGANLRSIRARHVSFAPSAALVMHSICRSSAHINAHRS